MEGSETARSEAPARGEDAPTHWKGFELLDFQRQAIAALSLGRNVLLSAPTGAGKTLVAEYAIEDAVRRGKRCLYTAPIKALSNQKYRDFRDEPEVDVGLMTGDVTINPRGQVLIMTTEILRNAILEDPRSLSDVESVVFDEVHFLDDAERGTVWEESLIFAPSTIRFVCLSATVSNIDELGAWIGEIRPHPLEVICSEKRPVPLGHHLFTEKTGSFPLRRFQKVRQRLRREESGRGKRPRSRSGRGRSSSRGRRGPRLTRPELLFDELMERDLLPTLVFAFSRKDCERLARKNVGRDLLSDEERTRMSTLQDELIERFQLERVELRGEIFSMARHGIAYHHAGMLPINKELVERMFTSGLLKMLFTTETFALGINMPARSVVFHSLRKFDGQGVNYLRTREYMQMAGRAGRQGLDDVGTVFTMLDERDVRDGPIERILSGRPEPVKSRFRPSYSSLLHLLERLGRERLHEAWDKSFSHFQLKAGDEKDRARKRRRARRDVEARLAFLEEIGYVEGRETLTPRGRTARTLNGYEIEITEMLFAGVLEDASPPALAAIFVAQVYEERRRGVAEALPRDMLGPDRREVGRLLARLVAREAGFGVPEALKMPDFGLTPAVLAWFDGADFDELAEICDVPGGDVCRTLRMALQLMRQVRRLSGATDLADRLEVAISALDRDEIDARRQLELG